MMTKLSEKEQKLRDRFDGSIQIPVKMFILVHLLPGEGLGARQVEECSCCVRDWSKS